MDLAGEQGHVIMLLYKPGSWMWAASMPAHLPLLRTGSTM